MPALPANPPTCPGNPEHWHDQPDGADLFLDPALIRRYFPYLTPQTIAVLHARRCGWFSGQQLGMLLLEQAKAHGVRLLNGRVTRYTDERRLHLLPSPWLRQARHTRSPHRAL